MKIKKAAKKLDGVESLLSEVIDNFAEADEKIQELLMSAKKTVLAVKREIDKHAESKSTEKPAVKRKAGGARSNKA